MLIGRNTELSSLEEAYQSRNNTLTILYGRTGIGKTELVRAFMKGKKCLYYHAGLASEKQQLELFNLNAAMQFEEQAVCAYTEAADYRGAMEQMQGLDSEVKLLVIEEFQNIVKNSREFMEVVAQLIKGNLFADQVMVILTSSSISWIENNMETCIGASADVITTTLKLKELNFVDTTSMFPAYSIADSIVLYAITGGVPAYLVEFEDGISIRENICRHILAYGCRMSKEGGRYIQEELRETSLYNTILSCIAEKEYKLNELHLHTGFGRDKISVYLKNLIEREIAEKVFSFDTSGSAHTRKGLYRIKAGYIEFWFRYIYPTVSWLTLLSPEEYYDRFIRESLDDYVSDTFVKAAAEYVERMDRMGELPLKIAERGRWWGKNGNIDLIVRDEDYQYLIGQCNWTNEVFTFEMFEELMYNINLAGIGKQYIYLFSKETFDEELTMFAHENENVKLISLNDM